jgi:hypothetical protein
MTDSAEPNTPLLREVSQYEVDFVIPRLGMDLPLGIDPFLMFKSRDETLQQLHSILLDTFNHGVQLVHQGKLEDARKLLDFPEVQDIGLGYTRKGKRGVGVGNYLTELIIETLLGSPALCERGVKHIEEMQLVSVGIGPDRISDISANILKKYLIEYTQKQCNIWSIPLSSGVPVAHILDPDTRQWYDGYFDLPTSSYDNTPIILVPRRLVRTLPWINYDDFLRMEFTSYLRAKKVRNQLKSLRSQTTSKSKQEIVAVVRSEVERIDRYIAAKEASAPEAQPSTSYLETDGICSEVEQLKQQLSQITPGTEGAAAYQMLVLEALNFLFSPELIDGEPEVKTVDGTERRDIVFTNDSDKSFWAYLRLEHSSIFLMFETKNVAAVDNNHINQTSTYLGDRLGRLGVIVTRNALKEAQERKIFSVYNDSHPRKIILVLSDADLVTMLDMHCQGKDPMRHIQKIYRAFRTSVQ